MTRKSNDCPEGQWGPVYAINAGAKFRKREGALQSWPREDRIAYANAVEAAVLAAQASALRREVSLPVPVCASHSWANSPGEVGDVVRRQQAAALAACPSQVRRSRTPHEWETMYAEAMPADFVPSWEREEVQAAIAA